MFAVLKLLSFLPFGSFLRGGSFKIIGILGLVAAVAFMYWKWKDNIQDQVRDDINAQLLSERIQVQEQNMKILTDVTERQNLIIQQAIERNQQLIEALAQAKVQIGAMEATPATPPLEAALDIIRQIEAQGITINNKPKAEEEVNPAIKAWREITGSSE